MRHGESTGNASGQIQGQLDMPLTERGRQQAQHLANQWASKKMGFEKIIASPLLRARETASIIGSKLNLPVLFDRIWMERSFGKLEGLTTEDIFIQQPGLIFQHPYHKPGESGESLFDLLQRASQGIQNLFSLSPGDYLIVSHGAILNMTMYAIMGLSPLNYDHGPRFSFGNTGYVKLTYQPDDRRWRFLEFINPDIEASLAPG